MTPWEDPTCHPGCENERGADGHHRAQFCVFCLRKIGDTAMLRSAELEDALRKLRPYFGTLKPERHKEVPVGSSYYDNAREAFAVLKESEGGR